MRFPQSDAGLHGSRVTAVSRVLHIRATRVRPRRVGFERKHGCAVDRHSGHRRRRRTYLRVPRVPEAWART